MRATGSSARTECRCRDRGSCRVFAAPDGPHQPGHRGRRPSSLRPFFPVWSPSPPAQTFILVYIMGVIISGRMERTARMETISHPCKVCWGRPDRSFRGVADAEPGAGHGGHRNSGRIAGASRQGRLALARRAGCGMVTGPLAMMALTGTMPAVQVPVGTWMLVAGGVLVGIGVTFGAGCTSGHGVCGLARLSPRSLVATVTFMLTTGITVYVVRQVMGA